MRDRYVVLIFDELDKRYRAMLNVGENAQVSYGVVEGEVMAYAGGAIEEHSSIIYDNVKGLVVIFGFSDRVAVDIPGGGVGLRVGLTASYFGTYQSRSHWHS